MWLQFIGSVLMMIVIFIVAASYLTILLVRYCKRHSDERLLIALAKSLIKYGKIYGKIVFAFVGLCRRIISPRVRLIISRIRKNIPVREIIKALRTRYRQAKERREHLRSLQKMREPRQSFQPVHFDPEENIAKAEAASESETEVIDVLAARAMIAREEDVDVEDQPKWRIFDRSNTPDYGEPLIECRWEIFSESGSLPLDSDRAPEIDDEFWQSAEAALRKRFIALDPEALATKDEITEIVNYGAKAIVVPEYKKSGKEKVEVDQGAEKVPNAELSPITEDFSVEKMVDDLTVQPITLTLTPQTEEKMELLFKLFKDFPGIKKVLGKSLAEKQAAREFLISSLKRQAAEDDDAAAKLRKAALDQTKRNIIDEILLIPEERRLRDLRLGYIIETDELYKKAKAGKLDWRKLLTAENFRSNNPTQGLPAPVKEKIEA